MGTQLGQPYSGSWPEYPLVIPTDDGFEHLIDLQPEMVVRYPSVHGMIKRGIIKMITGGTLPLTVHFTNGDWCYETELSEDRD